MSGLWLGLLYLGGWVIAVRWIHKEERPCGWADFIFFGFAAALWPLFLVAFMVAAPFGVLAWLVTRGQT